MNEQTTILDVKGLMCPLPVLKARKALGTMPGGSLLVLVSTDPASVIDVPHFCNESGHQLVEQTSEAGAYLFKIRRSQT